MKLTGLMPTLIVVNVNENTTGNERRFTIQLEMGDYFDSISVTQVK